MEAKEKGREKEEDLMILDIRISIQSKKFFNLS
jgi:hypothetical protein